MNKLIIISLMSTIAAVTSMVVNPQNNEPFIPSYGYFYHIERSDHENLGTSDDSGYGASGYDSGGGGGGLGSSAGAYGGASESHLDTTGADYSSYGDFGNHPSSGGYEDNHGISHEGEHHTYGHTVPISEHVEVTKPVAVPVYKEIGIPVPHPVRINIPHPVAIGVPQPYPVAVPVAQPIPIQIVKTIAVPVEKKVPFPVEKHIPVPIEKAVPITIEKHIPVPVLKPYPIKIPIYKTIYHHHGKKSHEH